MGTPVVFYAPLLHKELAPPQTPASVVFFPVGPPAEKHPLPSSAPEAAAALALTREALPLGPKEARAALEEMLYLGRELAGAGTLRQMAAEERRAPDPYRTSRVSFAQRTDEREALEAFAATGQAPFTAPPVPQAPHEASGQLWPGAPAGAAVPDAQQVRRALLDCQKTLLLAHALESNSLEIQGLEVLLHTAETALEASLGEEDEDFAALRAEAASLKDAPSSPGEPGAPFAVPEHTAEGGLADGEAHPLSLAWRTVLESMAPFLPEPCRIFTADSTMARDLRDAGMLEPLPEDRAALCVGWPESLVAGLLWTALPAWRLAGYRAPVSGKPWLARVLEVLVARPAGGWQADEHKAKP